MSGQVPPVVLEHYPLDLNQLPVDEKKNAFLHSLLPMALIALNEVEVERDQLIGLLARLRPRPESLTEEEVAQRLTDAGKPVLTEKEKNFIINLTDKYRTTETDELLRRVRPIPVSLLMAQGLDASRST